jgi:ribonuclease BN (tRNA processing enzyme)
LTRLVFLGTKGEIEEFSSKHQYHSSLLLTSDKRLLFDYGTLRNYSLKEINPEAILITHAHPDHYAWLKEDIATESIVYLTNETLDYGKFRPKNYRIFEPGKKIIIGQITCLPYRVLHSIRCPAVGYRIETPNEVIVYNPDLVDIVDKDSILPGVDHYIGDGSSIKTNLVRLNGDKIFGHTRITTQIGWCQKYGINQIIFTHIGKETLEKETEFSQAYPKIILAYDGMELVFND